MGAKALVCPLLPCTGNKRIALLARQWVRLPWLPLIPRSAPSPGIWYCGKAPQRQWTGMRLFQSPVPNDAIVWSPPGASVQMTLGAMLCMNHSQVLGCWAELLWIWLKAAIVLTHQSVLKDQSQSSSREPPKPLQSSACSTPWASETRPSTKGRKGLDFIIQILFLCPENC